jgi:hypothetical protein
MLNVTNGEATRNPLEQSGVPGVFVSWDDLLAEGPTPLASGDEWARVRARYLASAGYGDEDEMLRDFRAKGDPLEQARDHEEVVFWFEHDLHCQLLLIHHLWWLSQHRPPATRLSIVIGPEHLGLLKPADFPSRFVARRAITDDEITLGAEMWTVYCGDDPTKLMAYLNLPAAAGSCLAHLPRAMHRLLEEFPAAGTGLARSERQILDVLSEGPRSPEQAFVACARLEDDIWMGDWSFWRIVRMLAAAPHPLVHAATEDVPGRLPAGTLTITDTGRQVLAGRADHVALNAPSRWIGGTRLTPERMWRWTGSSVQPASL